MSDHTVVIEIESGEIVLDVFQNRAPQAANYFLGLVARGAYDGSTFYRSTTLGITDGPRLVQAGPLGGVLAPDDSAATSTTKRPELLPSFESTVDSGLAHTSGTLSMARDLLDTGQVIPEFFLCLGPFPQLDAGGRHEPDERGFPAIGRIVRGLNLVEDIASSATGGRTPVPMLDGEILSKQVRIHRMWAQPAGSDLDSVR